MSLHIALFISTLLLSPASAQPEAPDRADDLQEIISVLVADRLAAPDTEPGGLYVVVASDSLTFCPEELMPQDCGGRESARTPLDPHGISGVPAALRKAVVDLNRSSSRLPVVTGPTVKVTSMASIDKQFRGDDLGKAWDDFYRRYRGSRGFMQVGVPAISDDGNEAFIHYSHACGGLCGTGWLVYLRRVDGKWKIEHQVMLWIS
jgi:hypothetical protein